MAAISEEIADVEIMLEQLKTLFGNRADVDCWKAKKLLQRLIERMDGHNDWELHGKPTLYGGANAVNMKE